jgi:hypothetical protein
MPTSAKEGVMQCPVCRGQAENLTPTTLDGVVVSCHSCGDYRISGTIFYAFTRLQDEKRVAALAAAKTAARAGWPTICRTAIDVR